MINGKLRLLGVFVCACIGGVAVASGDAVSIVWSSQNPGSSIATSNAVELPPGMLVRLGVFDVDESTVEGNKGDADFLNDHFTEITREVIGTFGAAIVLGGSGHHDHRGRDRVGCLRGLFTKSFV